MMWGKELEAAVAQWDRLSLRELDSVLHRLLAQNGLAGR